MHDVFVEGGLIRKLWTIETSAYRDHLLRLDVESRHNLFAGAIPDEIVRTSAATALRSDVIIHGFFVEGVLRGAAEMRILWPPHWCEAEAALSIEKPWQSHGVGSALLESSLLVARNRSIRLLHVNCLADNKRMQRLAHKFKAHLIFDSGEVVGNIEIPYPTPLSVMQEMIVDAQSFAIAYVVFQSRLLNPAGMFLRSASHVP